jgi:hypothetical protein
MTAPGPATAQLVILRADQNPYYRKAIETDQLRETQALRARAGAAAADADPHGARP